MKRRGCSLVVFVLVAILGYYAWQVWTTPKVTIDGSRLPGRCKDCRLFPLR